MAKNIVVIEDVLETRLIWKKILDRHKLNYIIFNSFREFQNTIQNKRGALFDKEKYTLITDLIFDGEDETGFDVIQLMKDHYSQYLYNRYMCTSLSANDDIVQVCNQLEISVFGKKDLDKIQMNVEEKS